MNIWTIRLIVLLSIAASYAGTYFYGRVVGHDAEEKVFTEYKANVEATAKAQQQHTQDVIRQQQQTTGEIQHEWETRYNALIALYGRDANRVRYITLRPRTMPAASNGSGAIDAPTSQSGFDTRHYTIAGCAQDALTVREFQQFVKKNHFPVEGNKP